MAKETRYDLETGEVIEGKSIVASTSKQASAVMIAGQKYAIKQQVNLPTLKHESGETICVKFIGPFVESTNEMEDDAEVDGVMRKVKRKAVINVARVQELSSGQNFAYVGNAMSVANLQDNYPENSYVGKCFAIQKLGTVAGKRYKETNIVEIEPIAA